MTRLCQSYRASRGNTSALLLAYYVALVGGSFILLYGCDGAASSGQRASTQVVTESPNASHNGNIQPRPNSVEAGLDSKSQLSAEQQLEVTKRTRTTRDLFRAAMSQAKRVGVECPSFHQWVVDQRVRDGWDQQARGSCSDGKMILESQGGDGEWGRDTIWGDLYWSEVRLLRH